MPRSNTVTRLGGGVRTLSTHHDTTPNDSPRNREDILLTALISLEAGLRGRL
jgi:hypothetical protein